MALDGTLIKEGLRAGIHKGLHGFVWIMKILIPVSLFTALLAWTGWLQHLNFLLEPAMHILSLPAMATLP
ncbi:MAG TPA: hypothetical protein VFG29_05650, partial [Syntrophales bacterium]|nr:hypothetical protein [Syntrophales bacterium]